MSWGELDTRLSVAGCPTVEADIGLVCWDRWTLAVCRKSFLCLTVLLKDDCRPVSYSPRIVTSGDVRQRALRLECPAKE